MVPLIHATKTVTIYNIRSWTQEQARSEVYFKFGDKLKTWDCRPRGNPHFSSRKGYNIFTSILFGPILPIHVRREAFFTGIRRAQHTTPHIDTNWHCDEIVLDLHRTRMSAIRVLNSTSHTWEVNCFDVNFRKFGKATRLDGCRISSTIAGSSFLFIVKLEVDFRSGLRLSSKTHFVDSRCFHHVDNWYHKHNSNR